MTGRISLLESQFPFNCLLKAIVISVKLVSHNYLYLDIIAYLSAKSEFARVLWYLNCVVTKGEMKA